MEHCQNQKSDKVPSVFCKHITNLISPFEVPGGEKQGVFMSSDLIHLILLVIGSAGTVYVLMLGMDNK